MDKKRQYVCSICKGVNITSQFIGWCDSNAALAVTADDLVEWIDNHYCEDCDDDVSIEEKLIKDN